MTVEIIGYSFSQGECHLYANDVDDIHLQKIERNRYDDGAVRELEFIFTKDEYQYLYYWLKQQKAVKAAEPKTLGDAVRATLGIVTILSGKYLNLT
jgi:hypothetical protein